MVRKYTKLPVYYDVISKELFVMIGKNRRRI